MDNFGFKRSELYGNADLVVFDRKIKCGDSYAAQEAPDGE